MADAIGFNSSKKRKKLICANPFSESKTIAENNVPKAPVIITGINAANAFFITMIYLKLLILVATFPKTLANLSIKLIPDPLIPASSPCRHLFLPVS